MPLGKPRFKKKLGWGGGGGFCLGCTSQPSHQTPRFTRSCSCRCACTHLARRSRESTEENILFFTCPWFPGFPASIPAACTQWDASGHHRVGSACWKERAGKKQTDLIGLNWMGRSRASSCPLLLYKPLALFSSSLLKITS